MSGREADAVRGLVNALEGAAPTGLPLLTLAEQSKLTVATTVKLLQRHTDYFVACGDTGKFRLNVFGPFKGNPAAIRGDIHHRLWRLRWSLVAIGIACGLGAFTQTFVIG